MEDPSRGHDLEKVRTNGLYLREKAARRWEVGQLKQKFLVSCTTVAIDVNAMVRERI